MPLTPAIPRKTLHRRQITCQGYQREDGLWDIEAHLVDTRTLAMETFGRGLIKPGEPLHEMWLRITIDKHLCISNIEAKTDQAPYPACPHFPDHYKKLVGETIQHGWTAKVRLLLGGRKGCTHIVELLGPIATTAIQTIYAWRGESINASHAAPPEDFINSCHSLAEDGQVVANLWPKKTLDESS